MPSTTNSRIAEIKAKIKSSRSDPLSDGPETHSIPWQNGRRALPVINLSVDSVVLNHRSHRIRSQIESHPEAGILEDDPFSDAAQTIIADILADTIGFKPLVDNLRESGQIEVGIITRAGVLVNGNTRVVALRQNGERYIRVAVLPEGATETELTELEARLQLARDYKQDYTLTNEFLFIKEQIDAGTSGEDLAILLGKAPSRDARHLRKGVSEIEKSLRILQHIREIQHMSDNTIPLTFFDEHDSALREADNVYIKLRDQDPGQARRIRDGRMAGVLVGVTYRNLRLWDGDNFVVDHIEPQFDEKQELLTVVNTDHEEHTSDNTDTDDALSFLEQLDSDEPVELDPTRLLATVAKYHRTSHDSEVTRDLTKEQLFDGIEEILTDAAQEYAQERRDQKRQSTPLTLVREARKKVIRAREALRRVRRDHSFNQGKFDYELRKLSRELKLLAKEKDVKS